MIPAPTAPTQMMPAPTQAVASASGVRDGVPPRRRARVLAVLACVLVAGVAIGLLTTSLVVASQADPARPSSAAFRPAAITTSAAPGALHAAAALVDREPPPVRASAAPVEVPRSPPRGAPRSPPRSPPRGSLEGPRAIRAAAAATQPGSPPARPARPPAPEDLYETR